MENITIPEELIQVCRDMAKVAVQHGLHEFSAKFSPPLFGEWHGDISFSWKQGRHGEDAGQIFITTQLFLRTEVSDTSNP